MKLSNKILRSCKLAITLWVMAACSWALLGEPNTVGDQDLGTKNCGYMTIEELKLRCVQGGFCDDKYCCEGSTVKVGGYLDYINIFDARHYPHLPYQKFRIIDGPDIVKSPNPWTSYTESLEVFIVGGNAQSLFEKISSLKGLPLKIVIVKGTVKGFNAYTNIGFKRDIYLEANCADVTVSESGLRGSGK